MANPLLDRAAPRDLADRGQVIERKEEIGLFPRLTAALAADLDTLTPDRRPPRWRELPVAFRLVFGWADHQRRIPALTGRVTAELPTVCQRCLEPLAFRVEQPLKLVLAEAGGSLDGFEAWEIEEPLIRPADIVDEVLVMAIPLTPMHASREACGDLARTVMADDDSARGAASQPFADLRTRMKKD